MAEILYIDWNFKLPDDQDYVLVEGTGSGVYLLVTARGEAILRQGEYAGLGDAMESAQNRAAEHNIETIYVKGVSRA
jgi:hypothetical protein